jgi:predicted GNAT family acetyltransferase
LHPPANPFPNPFHRAFVPCQDLRMHVLDNPVWHALTGPHATLAERAPHAARYQPDVSVFGGVPDDATPEAWDELAGLVGSGGLALVARRDRAVPDGWSVALEIPCRQMWLLGELALGPAAGSSEARIPYVALGASDVPEMLALVERTKPGPFLRRTVELGRYVGIRDGGDLVAMAGERLRVPGFTEVSAVCTDASQRGRGLASRLIRVIVAGIRARGETPFLHLTIDNESAHRLYDALGFETRALPDVVGISAPK